MHRFFLFSALLAAAGILTSHAGVNITALTSWSGDGWLSPAEYDPLNSVGAADQTRGIACSPVTGRVIVVTRKGGVSVRVLDGTTGAELHTLQPPAGGFTGGTFAVNMAAVGDDGVVYIGNLASPNSTSPLKVYRYENDDAVTVPTVAFDATGVTTGRLGDDMAVFGTGVNTRLAFGESHNAGTGTRNGFAVLTTADGVSFAGSLVVFPGTPPSPGDLRLGITFLDSDTIVGTQGSNWRMADFTGTAGTLVTSKAVGAAERALDYGIVDGRPLMANVETSTSLVRVYDMITPLSPTLAASLNNTTGAPVSNANGLGAVSWGPVSGTNAKLYALNSNNGIQAFTVTITPDIVPPSITGSPVSRTVYERGQTTFTVEASGTPPLSYEWRKDDQAVVPPVNAASLTINPVAASHAGVYTCRVSNGAPTTADSAGATLTVVPSTDGSMMTESWHLSPGSRSYLGTGNLERGMDYHPAMNRIYLVSRSASPAVVAVLDGSNGTEIHQLGTLGIALGSPPGTYPLNMIGVADDGVIYACSLSSEAGDDFAIYRWALDLPLAPPVEVFRGNPIGSRIGDSMDVRGSGANTQLLFGSRNLKSYVIFTPAGLNAFEPHVVDHPEATDAAFGHSIAFGEGNRVFGKVQGQGLVLSTFTPGATSIDPWTGVLAPGSSPPSFINAIGPLGTHPASGWLIGLENGNSENARLYDVPVPFPAIPPADLRLLEQEFLATDNDNLNGTGSISVSADRAFVLGTNNGLTGYVLHRDPHLAAVSLTGITQTMRLTGIVGRSYLIEKSQSLASGSWAQDGPPVTLTAKEQTVTRTVGVAESPLFFRAREP